MGYLLRTANRLIHHLDGVQVDVAFEIDGESVALRDMVPGDIAYVCQTWERNYRPSAGVSDVVYAREQHRLINRILAAPSTTVVIACSPDVTSTIHGWACGDADRLHYAYVPLALRGKGLARAMISRLLGAYPQRIEVTSRFHNGNEARTRFVHNPYPLMVNA